MKDEEQKIENNLKEQFRKLKVDEHAPEELKQEVFKTLDMLALVGEVVDLFTTKFTQTESTFLDLTQEDISED